MPINYQQLRTFHAIASDRSMTRAARRLGISQPTLSKQLKELQEKHQVQLFTGNRAPLVLTPEGEALVEKTKVLFCVTDDISALLAQIPPEDGGLLRIGSDSPACAAELVARLTAVAPKLAFRITIANATEANRLLMTAQVDVATIYEPLEERGYTSRPLASDRLMAVLPAARAAAGSFSLAALATQTLIQREATSFTRRATDLLLDDHQIVPARALEFQARDLIREAVARSVGIALMYERECPPDSRLAALPIASLHPSTHAMRHIAFRSERQRHPAIRLALKVALQELDDEAIAPAEERRLPRRQGMGR